MRELAVEIVKNSTFVVRMVKIVINAGGEMSGDVVLVFEVTM